MTTRIPALVALLWLALPDGAFAAPEDFSAQIARANELYQKGEYAGAAKLYGEIADAGLENGHLLYNRGNAHFRAGETGLAISCYLRARSLIPRDADLDANLKYAVSATVDRLADNLPGAVSGIAALTGELSWRETLLLLVMVNAAFWTCALFHKLWANLLWEFGRGASLALLTVVALFAGAKGYADSTQKTGVLLAKIAEVRSDFGAGGKTLFQLHEGGVVRIEDTRGDWLKINAGENRTGWTARSGMELP